MDIQANAVAGPMKVALHASVHEPGLIAGRLEPVADALMDLGPVRAVADLPDGLLLRVSHGLVRPRQFRRGLPPHNRPGMVLDVSGLARASRAVVCEAACRSRRIT